MHKDLYPILKKNPNKEPWWLLVILILGVAVFIGSLWSCNPKYTPERAINDVTKANNKQPVTVAAWLRGVYPCITTPVSTDSSGYKDWMGELDSINAAYQRQLEAQQPYLLPGISDSTVTVVSNDHSGYAKDIPGIVVDCSELQYLVWLKDDYIVKLQKAIKHPATIHDTVRVEDKTLPIALEAEKAHSAALQAQVNQLQAEKDQWQHKARVRWWWVVGLGAVIGLFAGYKVKKLFTPKIPIR